MHFLGYWVYQNFVKDIESGATFHYNSNQPRFHEKIDLGEVLWLVTGIRVNDQMQYHMAARFVIKAKTLNSPSYKYGRYRLWADPKLSDYYLIPSADMTDLLLSLEFVSKKPIQEAGVTIAQSLQAFRYLSPKDVALLEKWSRQLPVDESIPRIVPEIEVEEAYERGENALADKLEIELPRLSTERKREILREYQRNRTLVQRLKEMYTGRCQICAFDPITVYNVNACAGHHIHYLSRGGQDIMENLVLVCPNHHAVIHADDAVFDYGQRKFIFSNGRHEPLVLNHHL